MPIFKATTAITAELYVSAEDIDDAEATIDSEIVDDVVDALRTNTAAFEYDFEEVDGIPARARLIR